MSMVAGSPEQGRSGGGLISAEGFLIGVCNAADKQQREGLFAATSLIHEALDLEKLAFVFEDDPQPASTGKDGPASGARIERASATTDRQTPRMAGAMPTSNTGNRVNPPVRGGQLAETAAVVPTDDTEVVCIIRSRANPGAGSKVIVLDRASPELLDQILRTGRVRQASRRIPVDVPR